MSTSLEELRNKGTTIDTTVGKVNPPVVTSAPTLAETDPAFIPSNNNGPVKGGSARTPVIGETPAQPSIKVVDAHFDPTNATEFDITSLEKRKTPPSKFENEVMADLDAAVQREKDSITERIDALTEKQREEFMAMKAKEEEAEYSRPEEPEESLDPEDYDPDFDEEMNDEVVTPVKLKPVVETYEAIPEEVLTDKSETMKDIANYYEEHPEETAATNNTHAPSVIGAAPANNYNPFDIPVEDLDADIANETDAGIDTSDALDEDLAAETGEPDSDAIMQDLVKDVKSRITPITKRIDLNEFRIADTHISHSEAKLLGIDTISTADHFLPNAGKVISCSALSGSELMALNPENSNRNRINMLKDIYSIMYKHVVSPKPKTFDEWLKTTHFRDLDHIYFALYKATFGGSHFMHYECPNDKCKDVFIEDVAFADMIEYADEEIKAKMQTIMNSGDSSITEYETSLHQISDNIVVGIRNPSIYNVVIENSGLSDEFLSKYNDLMDVSVYIDSIYIVDYDTKTLKPVDMKPDKNNITKTAARRVKVISEILRTLPTDNYYELRKCIATAYPSMIGISYKIPETTCKKCGAKIEAQPIEAQQLLFMRHQLGAFVVL